MALHACSLCLLYDHRSLVPVLVLRYHLLLPCSRCRFQVHLFQLTPALQQFKLACRRRYAMTIQHVPGTPPHRAFLFLHQYYRTASDRFRAFLEALEVVARKQFIPG